MTDILLTNDDGYKSAGFLPLLKELSKEFSVVTVTPDKEKSWVGKAVTTKKPLKLKKVKLKGFDIFTINGTPADCVQIGLYNVLDYLPKMVVSGINQGSNVGHARILSSGTVGATMEAAIEGVKALASSLRIPREIKKTLDLFDEKNYVVFENAAKITAKLTKMLIDKEFDDVDLFSANIPFNVSLDAEIEITKPFKKPYGKLFYEQGDELILRTPNLDFVDLQDGTDLKAISEGKVSLTPINLSLFKEGSTEQIKKLIKI
ncbi:MAG: 5'/3'-nucleotidase SurE [Candidatus Thermoplasmatota archaeon]|jgi:5'-nucleotidase|nr:5'/3'-nucleotidase SurE [Candidatus Thermoplasmatota archaeon]